MATRNDQAFVLRLSDYSESSQIASLFTREHGLVRLLAKGARRSTKQRVATGLDLLEYGEVSYIEPKPDVGLGTLTEWRQRAWFPNLRQRLPAIYAGLYAVELVPALTAEFDPHPAIFEALARLLAALDADEPAPAVAREGEAPAEPLSPVETAPPVVDAAALVSGAKSSDPLRDAARREPRPPDLPAIASALPLDVALTETVRFQAALLRAIGLAPNLRTCQSCGRAREPGGANWFSSRAGGLICRNCQAGVIEKRRLPAGLMAGEAETAQPAPAAWFDLLEYHLNHAAGRAMHTGPALRRMLMGKRIKGLRD